MFYQVSRRGLPEASKRGWVLKHGPAANGIWTGHILIQSQRLNPLSHFPEIYDFYSLTSSQFVEAPPDAIDYFFSFDVLDGFCIDYRFFIFLRLIEYLLFCRFPHLCSSKRREKYMPYMTQESML